MTARGLVIAAPASGSGKTTITVGLIAALRARGLNVAAAKVGPDYIDPSFHAAAGAAPCVNLDPWAMRPATLHALLATLQGADLVVCEGVMGLFDGIDAAGAGSTAELAARLGWPVALVVDCRGLGASIAALVEGFRAHRGDVTLAGVIANRVGGARHAALIREAVERTGVAFLGALARDDALGAPERHLGLVPASERKADGFVAAARAAVTQALDLDAIAALARPARTGSGGAKRRPPGQRIAVARDDAFAFAYPWMLQAWREQGAELSFFAPLQDEPPPPESDAVFLPGGYPELHAGRLAAAARFRAALAALAARGVTIYGECGGYMALGDALVDADGVRHDMLGLLPLTTSFAGRRLHLGYRRARLHADGPLGARGTLWRGHEFHYARILAEGNGPRLFDVLPTRNDPIPTGLRRGSVMGSFIHLIDPEISD
jgi:cobyrinic acid a,c-diamide synthase